MQRQNTFPVLALSYLHMTQEGGHDLDIHGSLMASSRSAGALHDACEQWSAATLSEEDVYNTKLFVAGVPG